MPDRLKVGQQILDLFILVRFQVRQKVAKLFLWLGFERERGSEEKPPGSYRKINYTRIIMDNIIWGLSIAHWLVLLSAVISLSGAVAYIRDMFRGKSKPNLVTWGLWGFAPLIATGAALSINADQWSTVRIFMSGFGPLLVFLAAFVVRQGYWKLSSFDYACGGLSLVALFAWLGADSAVLAILLAAIAELFATLPTIIKAWKYPETETLYTYFVGLFTASIVIPAIPVWNIENAAFQVYLLVANTTLFFIVLRGHLKKGTII